MKKVLSILILTSLSYFYFNSTKINEISSVLEFGYDSANSLNYKYHYNTIKDLKSFNSKDLMRANHHSPLFLDMGRQLLVYTTKDNKLILWDTLKKKIFKEIKIKGLNINASPIIHKKDNTIIVKSIGSESRIQTLTTVDFNGNILSVKEIDLLDAFLDKNKEFIPSKIHCKTSLSHLQAKNKESYIVFGCSIKTQVYDLDKKLSLYGTHRGLTGLVVASKVGSKEVLYYKTSIKTNNAHSGYDTGIYLSGGSIPIKNNLLYVSTGNGPIDSKSNHGCSILKLELSNNKINLVDRFTSSKFTKNECHSLNLDMTSSSPVFLESKNKDYAFITSKSGVLHAFDLKTMGKEFNEKIKISELPHYSQGATFKLKDKNYFLTHWMNSPKDHTNTFSTSFEKDESVLIKSGFTKASCIGSVSKEEAKDYSLLYSGEFRDSYLSVPSSYLTALTSPVHPNFLPKLLPFLYPVKDIWPNYEIIKKNTQKISRNKFKNQIELNFYNFYEESIFLLGKSDSLLEIIKENPIKKVFIKSTFSADCNNEEREKLYLYKKTHPLEKGWGVKVFTIENQKLSQIKEFNFEGLFNPSKSSPTVVHYNGSTAFLIIGHSKGESIARLIDLETYKVIKEFKFNGEGYFSRPLWTPNFLLLPTRSNGLKSFEIIK
ncbi:hypothetical protein [Halobacteriovorax sp.]|uniref:hypothetical protein n=1 Tax=Halobacteriovorax sp. TaxID=2020862 RepID=UPI0035684417